MADVALTAGGIETTPLEYTIPGAQEIIPKACTAAYDGSGAGGPFVPTLLIRAPNGAVLAACPVGSTVAAGASADASWFPRSSLTTNGAGGGGELDYAEITASVTVNGLVGSQTTIITGNPVAYDGVTRVRIEVYTPILDLEGSNFLIVALWEDATDLARMGQLDLDPLPTDLGLPTTMVRYLIPSAGTHTYTVKGWVNIAHGVFGAGTGSGGSNTAYMPAYMRISEA